MTTPAWPDSLSTKLLSISGYQEDAIVDPSVRTTMDSGPPKARSRFTFVPIKIDGVLDTLSTTDVDNLISFWENDCANGSLNFTWNHPRTGASATFLWMKFPSVSTSNGAGTVFQATVSILKVG